MSSTAKSRQDILNMGTKKGKKTTEWVKWNLELVMYVPEPGDAYRWSNIPDRDDTPDEIPEGVMEQWNAFNVMNVIKKAGKVPEKNDHTNLWETDRDVYRYAEALYAKRTAEGGTLPECDHRSGFDTIDPERGIYECGFEWCDERYSREVIEDVFF